MDFVFGDIKTEKVIDLFFPGINNKNNYRNTSNFRTLDFSDLDFSTVPEPKGLVPEQDTTLINIDVCYFYEENVNLRKRVKRLIEENNKLKITAQLAMSSNAKLMKATQEQLELPAQIQEKQSCFCSELGIATRTRNARTRNKKKRSRSEK